MKLSNEVKIGIMVFAAAVIFIGGIMYLRGIDFRKKEYSLTVLYENVNGLKEGSPVTVAGFAVGKVEEMRMHGTAIAVNISIQNRVPLAVDSRASIKSASIMGGKYIAITPGADAQALSDGDTLRGSYEADLTELTSTLSPISSNVLGILQNVSTTFDENTRHNIQTSISDISKSTASLDRLIQTQSSRIENVIGNFGEFSGNLARFSTGLDTMARSQRRTLDSSLSAIKTLAENLTRAAEQLRSTTQSLNTVIGTVESGQGTLGKLVHDDRLYNHIDRLAVSLDSLARDLRERPGRYVKLSLF